MIYDIVIISGATKLIRSCGMEGFKNAKKGTNVAAQATAINTGSVSAKLFNYKLINTIHLLIMFAENFGEGNKNH